MSVVLAAGYSIRHPHIADAEAVQALMAASDIAEFGEADGYSLDELRDDWKRLDLERDAWVAVAPDGTLAGYGYVWPRRHVRIDVEGYVHPEHFGCGIGTSLIRLSEARAREHVPQAPPEARVVINNWINALNADARALLEREGYAPIRYFWRMEANLDERPASPAWPAGITLREAAPDQNLRSFYDTEEEAMVDHWGHVHTPFEEWVERRTGSTFDPALWFLAMDGKEPAGATLCSVSNDIGWVDSLVVRRPWRRRGLGLALLQHAFDAFSRRGLRRARLGVDAASPTGATRLYERAGMHAAQEHATYSKELRPGVELFELEESDAHDG
jgi:GNAT superfamily N-acetyltransferase